MAVLLFQEEQLLDATVHIRSCVVPGIIWVVLQSVSNYFGERRRNYLPTLSVSDQVSVRYLYVVRKECRFLVNEWRQYTSPLSGRTLANA